MNTIFDEIYKRAEPYWNTRQNHIHVPMAYDYAQRLLTTYPAADEAVVLPAILLHDVGWKMVPAERQKKAFGPKATDLAANRLHEEEGVRIAGEILASLNYDPDKTQEILTIIDGHDSRLEALSLNDKLVKDADKLWRFSPTGTQIDYQRFGIPVAELLAWLQGIIDDQLFTTAAKDLARQALAEARTMLLPDSSA